MLNDDLGNTMNSLKSETINKINKIPYIPSIKLMPQDQDLTVVKEDMIGQDINLPLKKEMSIREKEFIQNNLLSRSPLSKQDLKLSDDKFKSLNEPDDFLMLDENFGGLEFYKYLEKTVLILIISL
jgi:hypothetical protein